MAAGDAAGLPHGNADCVPHVAFVFNEDVRYTIADRSYAVRLTDRSS